MSYISEIISVTVTNMVYIITLARYHGMLNGAYPETPIKDYAYSFLTRVGITCGLECISFAVSLFILTFKFNLPLITLWRKRWKWYILVTIIQTCFILIYAIISSHLSLVIDTDIVKNHKFGIPANATLLNCNGTQVTFWSQ